MTKSAMTSLFLLLALASPALGSTQSGLAWESPLQTIVQSITGPVAYGFSLVGVVVAGIGFVMGGELQGFIKIALIITLAISLVLLAANVLTQLFGVSGAIVTI